MEINYLILVHQQPEHLWRMISRLRNENSRFYIHVDKHADVTEFKRGLSGESDIFFLENSERFTGTWGDIGIVHATIAGMKKILGDDRKGFIVLLSGQDYPIVDRFYINDFFKANPGSVFMKVENIPYKEWSLGGRDRVEFYKINRSDCRGDYIQLAPIFNPHFLSRSNLRSIKYLLQAGRIKYLLLLFKKRNPKKFFPAYGGDQWWAMPVDISRKVLEFIQQSPDYLKFHYYTLLPDEVFFQSIIMHLYKIMQDFEIRNPITYINWNNLEQSSPGSFKIKDLGLLHSISGEYLFARKFDPNVDPELLDQIDMQLLKLRF